jgi:hypothetical protein
MRTFTKNFGLAIVLAVVAVTSLFAVVEAEAATRTVCMQLAFNDDRISCPDPGTPGARFTCNPTNGWSTAMGATVELWDKDPVGADEFIGYFLTAREPGYSSCFTFEWEGSVAYNGETHPDVYIRYGYEASGTSNGNFVQVRDLSNIRLPPITWRNGTSGNPDQYVANNCLPNVNCWINGGTILIPNSSGSSQETVAMSLADSGGFAMVPWISDEDQSPSRLIRLLVGTAGCSTGCANSETEGEFTWTKANQPEVVMHELGHIYHFRAFDGQMSAHSYDLFPDGPGWGVWTSEWQKAAFLEGWATYFAAVAYYDPNSSSVTPIFGTYNIESNVYGSFAGSCSSGAYRIGNVVRAFWDMDDTINEASHSSNPNSEADQVSWATIDLLRTLEDFSAGTANRRRQESGTGGDPTDPYGDLNGVNMRDFIWNGGFTTATSQTLLEHNCLENQDDN